MTQLPGILGEIAAVAGEDAALAIAAARGGTEVYFPAVPKNDHWLCRLIGRDQAKAICEQLTAGVGVGRRADVPLGMGGTLARAQRQRDEMLRLNRSERDISLATGYTIRSIRSRRKAMNLPTTGPEQLKLF